jgi:uncharacterized protein (TIGR02466 family)
MGSINTHMHVLNLFPTCVWAEDNQEVVKDYLPIAEDYLKKFGRKFRSDEFSDPNHISTYNVEEASLYQQTDSRLNGLTSYLIQNAKQFLDYQNVDSSSYKFDPYYLFNKIGKDSGHAQHAHPESIISGCIYLKASENNSPIIFKDPRPIDKYYYYKPVFNRLSDTYKLLPEYSVPVHTGLILMWNSWLEHEIPRCYNDDERITIAFNLSK